MQNFGPFDLWNYSQAVASNGSLAKNILDQVSSGKMPKGGPRWSIATVALYKSWIDGGLRKGDTPCPH